MNPSLAYLRFELRRTLRNRRTLFISIVLPLVLFVVIAGPQRHVHDYAGTGISLPVYYLAGMSTFGAMAAMLSSGARIAGEREVGWHRQLRVTPLSASAYLTAKVATSYVTAICTLVVLDISALCIGVRISPVHWLEMTGLILLGLVPFASLGILIGQLFTTDTVAPIMGGGTSLLALLGGAWGPIATRGIGLRLSELLPSYWLVHASELALGGPGWSVRGWVTMIIWTLLATRLAQRAYQRATERA